MLWSEMKSAAVLRTPVPELTLIRNKQQQRISLFDIHFVGASFVESQTFCLGADKYFELKLESGFVKVACNQHELGVQSQREVDDMTEFLRDLQHICHWFIEGELTNGLRISYFQQYARWINEKFDVDVDIGYWNKDRQVY